MRVAVLYDYLRTIGGGERVALTLAKGLGGDLYTTDLDASLPRRAGEEGVSVTNLGDLIATPPAKQIHASWRFARAHLPGYDAYVLVGNWAPFAAERHHPNLYYCLTPTRTFYDQRENVLRRLPAHERVIAWLWSAAHARFDLRAIRQCDRIVAISSVVQNRIKRYYGRSAPVIYPPVPTKKFRFSEIGDFWLSVSRMYPEKRIELQLETFRRLPTERLLIVGGYARGDRAERYVARLRPPENVTFLGEVPEEELRRLYATCRGFVTTAMDEDFGITPVEAMASGKAVLATDEGGYRETVVHGVTGFLLPAEPSAFVRTIRELDEDALREMKGACVARSGEFDEKRFLEQMRAALSP